MTLQALAPGVWSLPAAVNCFVVEDGQGGALVVDTGLDESHARKLLRTLEERHLTPVGILNTHSHADHHGGNAFILKRFPELEVFAPPLEAAIIKQPILEPVSLFGAHPPRELQSKFLLAPASPAQAIGSGRQTIGGITVELLDIPGHALEMYAVRVRDVLYAADGLFGPDSLQKHPLTFCANSQFQKVSARKLTDLAGIRVVLPGHGEPTSDLATLVQINLNAYQRTTQAVLDAVRAQEASVDDLLSRVCDRLGVQMSSAGAVVLNRSVVSAHLVELLELGQVSMTTQGNKLIFKAQ